MTFMTVAKRPSAFLPLAMSLAAFALALGCVAFYGAIPGADEGIAAHLFQILIVAQIPVVAFFAAKWLPRALRSSLPILALQTVAVLVALAPVYYFHL